MSKIAQLKLRWYVTALAALVAQLLIGSIICVDNFELLVLETFAIIATWTALAQVSYLLVSKALPKRHLTRRLITAILIVIAAGLAIIITFTNVFEASWSCLR
jgi:hypothetical protein